MFLSHKKRAKADVTPPVSSVPQLRLMLGHNTGSPSISSLLPLGSRAPLRVCDSSSHPWRPGTPRSAAEHPGGAGGGRAAIMCVTSLCHHRNPLGVAPLSLKKQNRYVTHERSQNWAAVDPECKPRSPGWRSSSSLHTPAGWSHLVRGPVRLFSLYFCQLDLFTNGQRAPPRASRASDHLRTTSL